MKLNEFLWMKYIEDQRESKKSEILNSPEYQETKLKKEFLENRMKAFESEIAKMDKTSFLPDEYEKMISLLNFVFADIPSERLTPRDRECLSEENFNKYWEIGVSKYECALSKLNGDMRKCTLLFFYLVLMWLEGHYTDISEHANEIEAMLKYFSYTLRDYSYDYNWVTVSQKEVDKMKKEIETESGIVEKRGKRKTNLNQRDQLNALYEKIFLKRAETVSASDRRKGITSYIDDKEARVIRLLLKHKPGKRETNPLKSYEKLVVRVLVKRDDSDLNRKEKAQNARNKLKEILQSEIFCSTTNKLTDICNKHIKRKKEIYDLYCEYYLGAESIFDQLNPDEVCLWGYLHKIYRKYKETYADKTNAEQYDISLKKNRCAWEILLPDERKALAEFVRNLDDDKGTYLKYIRGGSVCGDMRERYFHSLVADISDNVYDTTLMRLETIERTLQCAAKRDLLSDTEIKKLLNDLKEKVKKADEICLKIDRLINKKLLDGYTKEFQNALKNVRKNK